jgi:RNA polymerase sigma-70 factor (ECF subfamily)
MMPTAPLSAPDDAERFRPRLFGLAYRMLSNVHDAEDIVQDAMLRWQQSETALVREPEAWLVAVVTRLAIDRLRRANTERAAYTGPWLPEPVADERIAPDRGVELASDLSMAFLVLLEQLAPEERAAFLLREVFDSGYGEIASVLGKSEAAARQIVHRARQRVHDSRPRFHAPPDAKERLFHRFLEALEHDSKEEMLAVLAPDATWTSDGGGKVNAARRILVGNARIARMLLKFETKFEHPFTYSFKHLNGEIALMMHEHGKLFGVTFCETDGERIVAMYRVMNPDKLAHLE